MDTRAYLQRIHFQGELEPGAELLSSLHHANLLAVPFENLDIHLGRPIELDEQHLLEKIVASRRGGFCYELNGLFAWLLRELGFQVDLLSAEVFEGGTFSPEFDHLALRVRMEDDWLADVGFGDSFIRPLKLTSGEEQVQREKTYRLESDSDYWILTVRGNAGEWEPYYRFNFKPRALRDFQGRCRYHQTSPESQFTQKRVCTRLTEEGRLTLRDRRLIETRNGQRRETQIPHEVENLAALEKYFGIRLPEEPKNGPAVGE
jgi:N-hydroxyarylamine O-acetyltransferase